MPSPKRKTLGHRTLNVSRSSGKVEVQKMICFKPCSGCGVQRGRSQDPVPWETRSPFTSKHGSFLQCCWDGPTGQHCASSKGCDGEGARGLLLHSRHRRAHLAFSRRLVYSSHRVNIREYSLPCHSEVRGIMTLIRLITCFSSLRLFLYIWPLLTVESFTRKFWFVL